MKTFLGFFLLLIWYRSISESSYLDLIEKFYFSSGHIKTLGSGVWVLPLVYMLQVGIISL